MALGNDFHEKLKVLRQEYADLLPLRLSEIDLNWVAVNDRSNTTALTQLKTQVHTLAGSGATFGFVELSARASKLEKLIDELKSDPNRYHELEKPIVQGIHDLHRAATHGDAEVATMETLPFEEVVVNQVKLGQSLAWLGLNDHLARSAANQLSRFNYNIHLFTEIEPLLAHHAKEPIDVVLFDVGENQPFPNIDEVLGQLVEKHVPVICIGGPTEGLDDWLRLIRGGATTCVNRPFRLFKLLEQLDPLTFRFLEEPYKLFIVDDDEKLAHSMAQILTKAGMQVQVETNPMHVPAALASFKPDLILIDLYMPACSGLELARLIRQEPRYLTTPIVYLTAETEVNQKLAALDAGADDFILKPVKLRVLYHALSARIRRARQLSAFHQRDVLTGLLNHTSFQKELRGHLWHAIQNNGRLAVAILDLDRFKVINDHHGHKVGDRVLKTLAIKLKRRFAAQAVLARYDGAMFGIIFPSADEHEVQRLLDKVRADFCMVDHEADSNVFETSFSAGIAYYPAHTNATDLLEACQKTLFEAKSEGRNLIKLIGDSGYDAAFKLGSRSMDTLKEEDDIGFLEDEDAELLDDEEPEAPILIGSGYKVLVVDDDKQLLQVITNFLSCHGFEVFPAANGGLAFELAMAHKPPLVLIDLLLFPGIHGFELCKKIKKEPSLQHCKAILMTAVYKDYRYQVEGKEAGGDAFLIKPINFDDLMAKIKTLLNL